MPSVEKKKNCECVGALLQFLYLNWTLFFATSSWSLIFPPPPPKVVEAICFVMSCPFCLGSSLNSAFCSLLVLCSGWGLVAPSLRSPNSTPPKKKKNCLFLTLSCCRSPENNPTPPAHWSSPACVDSCLNPAEEILVFYCRFSIKMHDFRFNQKLAMQISRQDLV